MNDYYLEENIDIKYAEKKGELIKKSKFLASSFLIIFFSFCMLSLYSLLNFSIQLLFFSLVFFTFLSYFLWQPIEYCFYYMFNKSVIFKKTFLWQPIEYCFYYMFNKSVFFKKTIIFFMFVFSLCITLNFKNHSLFASIALYAFLSIALSIALYFSFLSKEVSGLINYHIPLIKQKENLRKSMNSFKAIKYVMFFSYLAMVLLTIDYIISLLSSYQLFSIFSSESPFIFSSGSNFYSFTLILICCYLFLQLAHDVNSTFLNDIKNGLDKEVFNNSMKSIIYNNINDMKLNTKIPVFFITIVLLYGGLTNNENFDFNKNKTNEYQGEFVLGNIGSEDKLSFSDFNLFSHGYKTINSISLLLSDNIKKQDLEKEKLRKAKEYLNNVITFIILFLLIRSYRRIQNTNSNILDIRKEIIEMENKKMRKVL